MLRFLTNLWNRYREYIVLVVLVIFCLYIMSLSEKPGIRKAKAITFSTYAAISSLISNVINTASIKNENEHLRRVNAELMLQNSMLRQYGIENFELKGLLNMKDTIKYPLVLGQIVSKSMSHSQNSFIINVGAALGIEAGMPVINDQGLIGIIQNTSNNYSVVRTYKSQDFRIIVKDERTRADNILRYNGADLILINVPKNYDIKPGDRIITSEMSYIMPVPIPVGVVKELTKVETGIFNEVKITPFANLDKSENVFVIKMLQSKEKNNLELNFYKNNAK